MNCNLKRIQSVSVQGIGNAVGDPKGFSCFSIQITPSQRPIL